MSMSPNLTLRQEMAYEDFNWLRAKIEARFPPRIFVPGDYSIVLNRPCLQCEGQGRVPQAYGPGPADAEYDLCGACDGFGRIATAEGQVILQHIKDFTR